MVDYRGPQFLKSICQRWNLDLFDRVVDIQIVAEPLLVREALVQFSDLEVLSNEGQSRFGREVGYCRSANFLGTADLFSLQRAAIGQHVVEVESVWPNVYVACSEFEDALYVSGVVAFRPGRGESWTPPAGIELVSYPEFLRRWQRVAATARVYESSPTVCTSSPAQAPFGL